MSRVQDSSLFRQGPPLPAWLISVGFHALLVLLLGLLLRQTPRGAAQEPGRTAGIVLRHVTESGERFEGPEDVDSPSESTTTAANNPASALNEALPTQQNAGVDPSAALPSQESIIGPGALEQGSTGGSGDLTRGGGGQPRTVGGQKARVRVFGVEGEGTKFAYVFDRSVSMTGARLTAAKRELIDSLASLDSTHQFQIIFFNHEPQVFDISGGQRRIPFADDRTKKLAENYVGGVTASGNTNRLAALLAAVNMRPDVIFFLTDTDDPMTARDLDRVRVRNGGVASINTIDFGFGPSPQDGNFLMRLARENGGQYVYIDTSRL
jgi:hypothetical protein